MKCKATTPWPELEAAIADLRDENGEMDTEALDRRLADLGLSVYPTDIRFGELEYDNCEDVSISLTQRYSEKSYEPAKEPTTSSDTTPCSRDDQQNDTPVSVYEWIGILCNMQRSQLSATEVN